MSQKHYIIEQILKNKKITDLLESRGIFPDKKYDDRWVYKCPLHEGDNDPSFMVYHNNDNENQTYYCFGCHSGINIIHLLCELDNISIKKAISILIEDIPIKEAKLLEVVVEEAIKAFQGIQNRATEIEIILLEISVLRRKYIQKYRNDKYGRKVLDQAFQSINKSARDNNIELLKEYSSILQQKFPLLVNRYLKEKEKEPIERHKWQI